VTDTVSPQPAVALEGIANKFGEFVALRSVTLAVDAGEVRLLPGPVGLRQDHAAPVYFFLPICRIWRPPDTGNDV
jgi:hypothetical protein